MLKRILLFVFVITSLAAGAQKLQSPEEFLGYKVGTHFTPHFKIVNYFNAVAQARPDMVKIEQYGSTYEGRPLLLTYIASPENLKNLENIRLNNLRMAGVTKDRAAPIVECAPAIVWLSYNVHGNEPASSEAAMLTLYALTDPSNADAAKWLKNTVVIIDPCINPDGRDRYVNWYNTTVAGAFNPEPNAREHQEPWPRGRTNHYNFDLNRDWAWQTQIETKQRLKKYNEWLPQVHVDYHEQGYNQPYYFAPAAEPYHEVITAWQRDFQVMIGKNNAKYFDSNGWLYFTKERFDLLYPSYGDTYPTYNGAIGMTFEQGGISAGLGVKTEDGSILTLVDRAQHHYTTGISTIEVSSANASKLVTEFKKYFDDTRNAVGSDYKTYVLTSEDANKLQAVADLLTANGIEFGTTASTAFKGYNYFTGNTESFVSEGYQLAVSAYQPKGKMVKVLFEPKSYLSDSATYDITAWSIPYAYGIKSYAVKEKLDVGSYKTPPGVSDVASSYGLLIPYKSLNAVKVLAELLQQNVQVRYNEQPFSYAGKSYSAGTLIVLKGNNVADWSSITNAACKKYNVQPVDIESGFVEKGADFGSPSIRFIHKPRVAMLAGSQSYSESAGEMWSFFDQTLHYPITQFVTDNVRSINLENTDVLIIPNGYYSLLDDKSFTQKLQDFVKRGGKLIALENAASQIADDDFGFKVKNKDDDDTGKAKKDDYADLKTYAGRERDYLPSTIPGAIFKVDIDSTHPLAFGYPGYYYTLKQDGVIYQFLKNGWNVGVMKKSAYISGFVGSKLKPQLSDGLLFGAQDYGQGQVVVLADDVIFRLFWENGKMMLSNAVFLVGQ
ncbi:MAG TPA: M14 family metallopeptidase [Panacibacter sp.]|nr:M14 family metallopeptidase [Panacibacter sp.]HNP44318.1 M14 family metallopeptidase [Panacibacter sp.]